MLRCVSIPQHIILRYRSPNLRSYSRISQIMRLWLRVRERQARQTTLSECLKLFHAKEIMCGENAVECIRARNVRSTSHRRFSRRYHPFCLSLETIHKSVTLVRNSIRCEISLRFGYGKIWLPHSRSLRLLCRRTSQRWLRWSPRRSCSIRGVPIS